MKPNTTNIEAVRQELIEKGLITPGDPKNVTHCRCESCGRAWTILKSRPWESLCCITPTVRDTWENRKPH